MAGPKDTAALFWNVDAVMHAVKGIPTQSAPPRQTTRVQHARIISKEALLAYPEFSKPFVIHMDASHHQLGAVISQDNRPIAFYSRKLTDAQTRYTTTERELLSVCEVLKAYRNILLGQTIEVHTDHKNLTYKQFNTERVMKWRLIIEECGPALHYIQGEKNIVADALSRLDIDTALSQKTIPAEPALMAELFANDLDVPAEFFPLAYKTIAQHQNKDESVLHKIRTKVPGYTVKIFHGGGKKRPLITYKNKIVMPKSLQERCIKWYHEFLLHPGMTRTEETTSQHFYWEGMASQIKEFVGKCPTCQKSKKGTIKYGKLPPKEAEVNPWDVLCVDLIGPYKITRKHLPKGKRELVLHCLTMIDPATGWFEIVSLTDKTSLEVANEAELAWFTRYPWPTTIIFDRGSEFMGEFARMCREDYGLKRKPINTRNPQANAIVERVHRTVGNMIRTQQVQNSDEPNPLRGALAAVGFAVRSTYHTTLQATPAQLVFGRDSILNIKHEAD